MTCYIIMKKSKLKITKNKLLFRNMSNSLGQKQETHVPQRTIISLKLSLKFVMYIWYNVWKQQHKLFVSDADSNEWNEYCNIQSF